MNGVVLTEDTIGMWFVALDDSDWMAAAQKTDDEYIITYQFRYHVDDKAFDSKDTKNWYVLTADRKKTTEGVVIDKTRMIAAMCAIHGGTEVVEILMGDGTVDEFMERLRALPFLHFKTQTKEEFEAERGSLN